MKAALAARDSNKKKKNQINSILLCFFFLQTNTYTGKCTYTCTRSRPSKRNLKWWGESHSGQTIRQSPTRQERRTSPVSSACHKDVTLSLLSSSKIKFILYPGIKNLNYFVLKCLIWSIIPEQTKYKGGLENSSSSTAGEKHIGLHARHSSQFVFLFFSPP